MTTLRHGSPRGLHLPGRCVRCDGVYRSRAGLTGSALLTPVEVAGIPERSLTPSLDDVEYAALDLKSTTNGLRVPTGWGRRAMTPRSTR